MRREIHEPIPVNIAGGNIFVYNKNKDNFSWKVILDDNSMIEVENELSSEYVVQLFNALLQAIDERKTYIKKGSMDAVPIPSKLVRKGL